MTTPNRRQFLALSSALMLTPLLALKADAQSVNGLFDGITLKDRALGPSSKQASSRSTTATASYYVCLVRPPLPSTYAALPVRVACAIALPIARTSM